MTVTHTHARRGTGRVGEQHRSHHQVAAVDVEGRADDVAGGLGGGEANQIGDFERGAEARLFNGGSSLHWKQRCRWCGT